MTIIGLLCDRCGETYGAIAWPASCPTCMCVNPVTEAGVSGC